MTTLNPQFHCIKSLWNEVNFFNKFFFISWFSNFNSITYLKTKYRSEVVLYSKRTGVFPLYSNVKFIFVAFLTMEISSKIQEVIFSGTTCMPTTLFVLFKPSVWFSIGSTSTINYLHDRVLENLGKQKPHYIIQGKGSKSKLF